MSEAITYMFDKSQRVATSVMNITLLNDAKYFEESGTKFAEMRKMLDNRDPKEKLEAMKRLMAMITVGRDVSSFFPDVVKCIIVDSQEVKKLVYMYLIHYSETNPDLALLSINSLQKDMGSSNARVRANALKAMSSIRIPVVIPLIMLALKSAVKDNSPYVKRAAAAAIPKVFAIDEAGDQKDSLVEMIAELFTSNDPQVLGSALFAFTEVCPHQWTLIHEPYRKFCNLLADFDEFGQIVAVNTLLRYGRTQFATPFAEGETKGAVRVDRDPNKPFYSDDEGSDDEARREKEEEEAEAKKKEKEYSMSPDHALLLKQSALLLQSANAGVIAAVTALYVELAPPSQLRLVVPPLVRLARNRRALQYVVYANIASLASQQPDLFRVYLKDFFVNSTDAPYVRALKLDILANVASEASISVILTEFQAYVKDADKEFVSQTIAAIGRCAHKLPSIAENCMRGLMKLVSSPAPAVVAQAVVVIRQLLQKDASAHTSVIRSLAKLLDSVTHPQARAALVWIVGEYHSKIPLIAPDCLRKLAKTFTDDADVVKQQTLNMAVKLYQSNPKQTALLFKYIMDLCKFDMSYDLRDRARLVRALFFKKKTADTNEADAKTAAEVKDVMKRSIMMDKPAVHMDEPYKERTKYLIGSLSHMVSHATLNYHSLPDFPAVPPDPTVRDPKVVIPEKVAYGGKNDRGSKHTDSRGRPRVRSRDAFYDSRDNSRSRSGSRSGGGSRSRSRSRGSHGSRSRSHTPDNTNARSRSGSRSRSRSRSGSRSRSRSRSGSRGRRTRSRSASRSRSRSRSRSASRSRSPSPIPNIKSPGGTMSPTTPTPRSSLISVVTPSAAGSSKKSSSQLDDELDFDMDRAEEEAEQKRRAERERADDERRERRERAERDEDERRGSSKSSSKSKATAAASAASPIAVSTATASGAMTPRVMDLFGMDMGAAPVLAGAVAANKDQTSVESLFADAFATPIVAAPGSKAAAVGNIESLYSAAQPDVQDVKHIFKLAGDGNYLALKGLVARGANVNAVNPDSGMTVLMKAAQFGHRDIVEFLLASGADVNARTKVGRTVRDYATDAGVQRALQSSGAAAGAAAAEITFLMGLSSSSGAASSLHTFRTSPLYRASILANIFQHVDGKSRRA